MVTTVQEPSILNYWPILLVLASAACGIWIPKDRPIGKILLTILAIVGFGFGIQATRKSSISAETQRLAAEDAQREVKAVLAYAGGPVQMKEYRESQAAFQKEMAKDSSPDFIAKVEKNLALKVPEKLQAMIDDPAAEERFERHWLPYKEYLRAQLQERIDRLVNEGYVSKSEEPIGTTGRRMTVYRLGDGTKIYVAENRVSVRNGVIGRSTVGLIVTSQYPGLETPLEFIITETGAKIPIEEGDGFALKNSNAPLTDGEALRCIKERIDSYFSNLIAEVKSRMIERQARPLKRSTPSPARATIEQR